MADSEREAERINAWAEITPATSYELRSGNELVEVFENSSNLGSDVCQAASEDCEDEGRRRKYKLVAIAEDRQQYVCPLVLRRRPERVASENIVVALTKQNAELHARLLEKEDKTVMRLSQALDVFANSSESAYKQIDTMRSQHAEVFVKLEELKTMQLERDLMKERHEKNSEMLERGVDTALPLGMAIFKKLTSGDDKANKMLDEPTLVQVCKGMQTENLDTIRNILGPELGGEVDMFVSQVVIDGHADVDRFKTLVGRMTHEQLMHIVATLNMGQQAALKELLGL